MNDSGLLKILEAFHGTHVLILGDVMLDRFIYGAIERISPEAPIPVMAIKRTVDMPGGAANVARNVATLGGQAILIGVIGDDEPADNLRRQIALLPTIEAQLVVDESRPTTVKARYVSDRQQILRTDVESTASLPDSIEDRVLDHYRAALTETDVIIISDYGKGVLSDRLTAMAITAARQAGKHVLVAPKNRNFAKYRGASVLVPNRRELQAACGHECLTDEQVIAGAQGILDQKLGDSVVVTRGRDGMSIIDNGAAATHIRTHAQEVFDVSGAGDTAIAAMSLGLANSADLGSVVRLANMAAGIVVGKHGTATVSAAEIIAKLDHAQGIGSLGKHFTKENACELADRWRELGLTIAFTNGCFDLLHPGHVSLLNQAKRSADRLVVGLNSDLSVRRIKGAGRPAQGEVARATLLASLKAVDAVVIFDEDTPLNLIDALVPDVLIKGADYSVDAVVGADLVLKRGGKIILADIVSPYSTSGTIKQINSSTNP